MKEKKTNCKKEYAFDLEKNACVSTQNKLPARQWTEPRQPQESAMKILADSLIGALTSIAFVFGIGDLDINVPYLIVILGIISLSIVVGIYVSLSNNPLTRKHLINRFLIQISVSIVMSVSMVYVVGFSISEFSFETVLLVWLVVMPTVLLVDRVF